MSGGNFSPELGEESSQKQLKVEKWAFEEGQEQHEFETVFREVDTTLSHEKAVPEPLCEKKSEIAEDTSCRTDCRSSQHDACKLNRNIGSAQRECAGSECQSVGVSEYLDGIKTQEHQEVQEIKDKYSEPTVDNTNGHIILDNPPQIPTLESPAPARLSTKSSSTTLSNKEKKKKKQINDSFDECTPCSEKKESMLQSFHMSGLNFSMPHSVKEAHATTEKRQASHARLSLKKELKNFLSQKSKNNDTNDWSVVAKVVVEKMRDESGIPEEPVVSILDRFSNATGSSFHVSKENDDNVVKWTKGPLMDNYSNFQQQLLEAARDANSEKELKSWRSRKEQKSKLDIFVSKPDENAFQNLEIRILGIGLKGLTQIVDDKTGVSKTQPNSGILLRSLTPDKGVTTLACIISESKNDHRIRSLHKALFDKSSHNVQMIVEKSLFIPLKQPKIENYPTIVPLSSNFLLENNEGILAGTSLKVPLILRDGKWNLPSKARFKTSKSGKGSDLVLVRRFLLWKPDQTWPTNFENKDSKKSWQDLNSIGVIFVRFVGITGQSHTLIRSIRDPDSYKASANSNKRAGDTTDENSQGSETSRKASPMEHFVVAPTDVAPPGTFIPYEKLHPPSFFEKVARSFAPKKTCLQTTSKSNELNCHLKDEGLHNPEELLKDKNFLMITGIS